MTLIRVVDLEATGFAPPEHAPCEIAYCDLIATRQDLALNPHDWQVRGGGGLLVNPGRPIPAETSAIHHIVDEDVKAAPLWTDGLAWVSMPPDQLPVAYAAHQASFEKQWLTPDVIGATPVICTYKCALRLWPDAPAHSNQVLRYWLNPAGLDRKIAAVAHRAYPDAYVTSFLLRELLTLAPLESLIEWSTQPALLLRVPFGKNRGALWTEIDDGLLFWVLDKDFGEDILFTARHEIERREKEREEQSLNQDAAYEIPEER